MSGMSSYETYEPTTYPWSVIISATSFVSIVISFASPYWLINDGAIPDAPFLNLGTLQYNYSYMLNIAAKAITVLYS